MPFDPFVIPFSIGTIFLLVFIIFKFRSWISRMTKAEKARLRNSFFSHKVFIASWEVFMESLLHRKIFKVNPVLGYMHMSLAFGWFMLIAVGNLESRLHNLTAMNLPYYPIFFKFFVHDKPNTPFSNGFTFLMDFFLALVLSGVLLAILKRFSFRPFGLKKSTKLRKRDNFALICLWFIFPLRLLAESFTSATYQSGGFLTGSLGNLFSHISYAPQLAYASWWMYSIALGSFFCALPFSRYMHIPTEVLLIYMRNFGIKERRDFGAFSEIEVYSCPRCGICIDKCQLFTATGITNTQSVYFIYSIRNNLVKEDIAFNCMVCGRCQEYCPVDINTNGLRLTQRKRFTGTDVSGINYLVPAEVNKADVIYFAGCMTHLTPSVKLSMTKILDASGINYLFIDEDGSVCCGRPLILAGKSKKAKELIEYNKNMILNTGAHTLVTSCPICYKSFTEDYKLNGVRVVHHSEYLLELAEKNLIRFEKTNLAVVYHDPCELGRGSGIYEQPRNLIKQFASLRPVRHEKNKALCCGGSLGLLEISNEQRNKIITESVNMLTKDHPDMLLTACPLCKKTFSGKSDVEVKDIAELIAGAMC
jgi:Fe-S oxidoreductase